MTTASKTRLTISIDPELVEAAHAAVDAKRATSVSAWINRALRRQIAEDLRLEAMDAFLRGYEGSTGEITAAEIAAVERVARNRLDAGGAPTFPPPAS